MTRQETIEKAKSLGLEFKKQASTESILKQIENAENPDTEIKKEDSDDNAVNELLEKLKAKEAELAKKEIELAKKESELIKPVLPELAKVSEGKMKADARKAALKLIRCIITSMDSDKSSIPGEIICCGNSFTGTVKKYIPFNKEWHVPSIIVDTLKEKKLWTTKERRTPKGIVKDNYEIGAYNVQILEDLTQDELNRLIKEDTRLR